MVKASEKVIHPYIISRKNYCGGSPVIVGTKFPVRADALSYYYDHKDDIEQELAENTEARLRPTRAELMAEPTLLFWMRTSGSYWQIFYGRGAMMLSMY
jgi:hypothetical protein